MSVFRVIPNVSPDRVDELEAKVEELSRKVSELACMVHPLLAYATPQEVTSDEAPTGG